MIMRELLNNAALLLALSVLYNYVFRHWGKKKKAGQVLNGLLFGCVALAVMVNPFTYSPGVVFDTRSVLISMAGLFGGPLPALITVLLTSAYRIWMGGAGALTGVLVIISSAGLGLAYRYWSAGRPERRRPLYLYGFGLVVHLVMLLCMLAIPWPLAFKVLRQISVPVLVIYPIASFLLSLLLSGGESRVATEEALKEAKEKYQDLYDNAPDIYFSVDLTTETLVDCNKTATSVLGYSKDELIGRHVTDLYHPDCDKIRKKAIRTFMETGQVSDVELQVVRKDGEILDVTVSVTVGRDEEGNLRYTRTVLRDITERKRAERALREGEERFELAMQFSTDGLFDWNLQTNEIYYSPGWKRLIGYKEYEIADEFSVWEELTDPESVKASWKMLKEVLDGKRSRFEIEFKMRHKNGHWVDILSRGNVVFDENGKGLRLVGTHVDITERKRAEKTLKEYKMFLDSLNDIAYAVDTKGNLVYANRAAEKITGCDASDILGKPFLNLFIEDDQASVIEVFKRTLAGESLDNTITFTSGVTCHYTSLPRRDLKGEIAGAFGIARDISKRLENERDLAESKARLQKAQEVAKIGNWEYDLETGEIWGSEQAFEIYGVERRSSRLPLEKVQALRISGPQVNQALIDLIEHNKKYDIEFEIKQENTGQHKFIHSIAELVYQDGRPVKAVGVIRDITEEKLIREEQENLKNQLRQAQKMEALGTLAGGIAHDFNNILAAIIGYSELALEDAEAGNPNAKEIKEIIRAGKRARDLVTQILTFSRKLEPELKPISLNKVVAQTQKMLARTIPKMIEIEQHLSPDLWQVNADASQFSQVLMNLGSNAKDAMPEGGRLLIETENVCLGEEYCEQRAEVAPGNYVVLTVTDTGHGMDKEIMEHIFDPFFTKKEVGKGTGLGLATVYGIVKNHAGYITCYSEVGRGTSFKIYLPAISSTVVERNGAGAKGEAPAGSETILLVDDEEALRDLGRQILIRQGYQVLLAENGEQALEVYRDKGREIDLVILDISMPGMGGYKCLVELLRIDPQARVVIASGYSRNGQLQDILNSGAAGFVPKPFSKSDLLQTMRKVLDG